MSWKCPVCQIVNSDLNRGCSICKSDTREESDRIPETYPLSPIEQSALARVWNSLPMTSRNANDKVLAMIFIRQDEGKYITDMSYQELKEQIQFFDALTFELKARGSVLEGEIRQREKTGMLSEEDRESLRARDKAYLPKAPAPAKKSSADEILEAFPEVTEWEETKKKRFIKSVISWQSLMKQPLKMAGRQILDQMKDRT